MNSFLVLVSLYRNDKASPCIWWFVSLIFLIAVVIFLDWNTFTINGLCCFILTCKNFDVFLLWLGWNRFFWQWFINSRETDFSRFFFLVMSESILGKLGKSKRCFNWGNISRTDDVFIYTWMMKRYKSAYSSFEKPRDRWLFHQRYSNSRFFRTMKIQISRILWLIFGEKFKEGLLSSKCNY